MPRVTLTAEQKERAVVSDTCKAILDRLNEVRGRERMDEKDFAARIGISYDCWRLWNRGKLPVAAFGRVLTAAVRAGLKIEVVKP